MEDEVVDGRDVLEVLLSKTLMDVERKKTGGRSRGGGRYL